jgi:hypothetical protein
MGAGKVAVTLVGCAESPRRRTGGGEGGIGGYGGGAGVGAGVGIGVGVSVGVVARTHEVFRLTPVAV